MLPLIMRCLRIFVVGTVVIAGGAVPRPVQAQEIAVEPDRQMPVRGGSLTLKVSDFAAARTRVYDVAKSVGAEITDGKTFVTEKGRKNGYVRLRVSGDHLGELLPAIRSVGILASDDLFTQDQASNYEDLGRRINRLRDHQKRLEGLLDSRRNLRGSDVLYIQERLFRAGVDEEQLLQERLDMERQARRASITVTLFEPAPIAQKVTPVQKAQASFAHWFANGMRRAEFRRGQLMAKIASAGAYAVVYAPIWIPLTLGAVVILRLLGRHLTTIAGRITSYKKRIQQAALLLKAPPTNPARPPESVGE